MTGQEDPREASIRVLKGLLDANFNILKVVNARLTALEDQVEVLENQKKKGKLS